MLMRLKWLNGVAVLGKAALNLVIIGRFLDVIEKNKMQYYLIWKNFIALQRFSMTGAVVVYQIKHRFDRQC